MCILVHLGGPRGSNMLSYCSWVGKGNWRSTMVGLSAGLAIYYLEQKNIPLDFR